MAALIIIGLILALILAFWLVQTIIGLVLMLVIVGLASLAAQSIVRYRGASLLFTMVSGFIGALVGIILARALNLPSWPTIGSLPIIWTLVGAVIVVAIAKVALPRRGGGLRSTR